MLQNNILKVLSLLLLEFVRIERVLFGYILIFANKQVAYRAFKGDERRFL